MKRRRLLIAQDLVLGYLGNSRDRDLTDSEREMVIVALEMNTGVSPHKANEYIETVLKWIKTGGLQAQRDAQTLLQSHRNATPIKEGKKKNATTKNDLS